MADKFDVVIAGAGIIGLATAYQLLKLKPDCKVLILEKEPTFAKHQTGHNSGVIHSGIYYKPGSLKAKNCIGGKKELLEFCDSESVPYKKLHKLIVATEEKELPFLRELLLRGQANNVSVREISPGETKELEPAVNVLQALYLPECHIVDFKQVAEALYRWICSHGGQILFNEYVLRFLNGSVVCENKSYETSLFINCAGLFSDKLAIASSCSINHTIFPFRGEYYELAQQKANLVSGLIYPVPDPRFPFLGVHVSPLINGKVEAGPNAVLATAREGYKCSDFNLVELSQMLAYPGFWKMASRYWKTGLYEVARSLSKRIFLKDLQRLVPAIQEHDLLKSEAGVRAQAVHHKGNLIDDFLVKQEKGAIHVLNAPSPAATASLSIGRMIAHMALK